MLHGREQQDANTSEHSHLPQWSDSLCTKNFRAATKLSIQLVILAFSSPDVELIVIEGTLGVKLYRIDSNSWTYATLASDP